MSLNGTIIVYPEKGNPPTSPDSVARSIIGLFEQFGLLVPDTASASRVSKPSLGSFGKYLRDGTLSPGDYANYLVKPERLTYAMGHLVWLLDVDPEGQPVPIELPFVEFTVLTKVLPIINGYDGRTLCETWASIEVSYEDVSYDEEIHRIRDVNHPIFAALGDAFASPVSWCVSCG